MSTSKRILGSQHATFYGATGLLRLEVFPSNAHGLYRSAVYSWFDRRPLFTSGSNLSLIDAKTEAEIQAAHHMGSGGPTEWRPGAIDD
jgi:hypothetical protein